jgi:hypothetical protein
VITHLATDLAGSPANWITGGGMSAVGTVLGAMWKTITARLKEQDADNAAVQTALTETNKTLAVLLNDSGHAQMQTNANTSKIAQLSEATAVLTSWREEYLRRAANLTIPAAVPPVQ